VLRPDRSRQPLWHGQQERCYWPAVVRQPCFRRAARHLHLVPGRRAVTLGLGSSSLGAGRDRPARRSCAFRRAATGERRRRRPSSRSIRAAAGQQSVRPLAEPGSEAHGLGSNTFWSINGHLTLAVVSRAQGFADSVPTMVACRRRSGVPSSRDPAPRALRSYRVAPGQAPTVAWSGFTTHRYRVRPGETCTS
jgi:hypothetical protein